MFVNISTQIIKNINTPICSKCRFFVPTQGLCNKFGEKNIITGLVKFDYAIANRTNVKLCGINGVYYESSINTIMSYPDKP